MLACALLGGTGCADDRFPLAGSSHPPGGGNGVGADGGGGARLTGRLCELDDLRDRASCRVLTGTELLVSSLSTFAPALDGGSFSIESPGADKDVLVVVFGDGDWFGGTVPVHTDATGGATDIEIPVMRRETVTNIVAASQATTRVGSSILVVRVDD